MDGLREGPRTMRRALCGAHYSSDIFINKINYLYYVLGATAVHGHTAPSPGRGQ
jgi:hypothetical protein